MQNLGKANARVLILDSLPNITKDRQFFDFDFSAGSWAMIQNSPYLPPLLVENIIDEQSGFSAIYPSKRKLYVDNYITDGSGSPITPLAASPFPYILWTPTVSTVGLVNQLVSGGAYDSYTLLYPKSYPSVAGAYIGPQWEDSAREREPYPDDSPVIKQWLALSSAASATSTTTSTTSTTTLGPIPKTNFINQTVTRDGLWWGVESNDFLTENMPFWVTIKKTAPPSSATHATFLLISLGIGVDEHSYDIYISNNTKPILIDYYKGREALAAGATTGSPPPTKIYEFSSDLAKILESDLNLEIGFMTIAGRLVISVNKVIQVFTRIVTAGSIPAGSTAAPSTGKIGEFKIAPGRIRMYGSNTQIVINASPMVFANLGCASLPVPTIPPPAPSSSSLSTVTPSWKNIKYDGTTGSQSVCVLPREPSVRGTLYGVDCATFIQDLSVKDYPKGFGFHKLGTINFTPASTVLSIPAANDFYLLIMQPSNMTTLFSGTSWVIPNAGCPYFFRIKGGFSISSPTGSGIGKDVSEDVITVSEDYQIDDYFAISGTASITLYNKGGKYDYLKNNQKGVIIRWGWNTAVKTFTGLIVSASVSEVPGREEITLTCNDYMYILKNTPMVNSPFYDGMVLFYAVQNIIRRGGVNTVVNDWDNTDDYFLPSGYSFTKPAVKFDDTQTLYDCAKSIVERGEAVFYFDQDGVCHVKKLPGGLLSAGAGEPVVASFTRNPNWPVPSQIILNEKSVEYDYSDTINRIVIATLDRDTRNAILYTKDAKGSEDILIYRRIAYEEQAALGDYDVAVARADELGQRVFKVIRKTSFQIVGFADVIYPLNFVTVDGDEFRLTGVSRKYRADSNDYVIDLNCEWLGG